LKMNYNEIIALTGTIGSGKSTALQELERLGAYVLSADELNSEVLAPGSSGLKEIVEEFGSGILLGDGSLNRKALAKIIFAPLAEEKRKKVQSITHPKIRELMESRFKKAQGKFPVLVYEVPILFELGLEELGWKAIVVVHVDDDIAVDRLTMHRGFSEKEARRRVSIQMPVSEKIVKADYQINNAGTKDELVTELKQLWEKLK